MGGDTPKQFLPLAGKPVLMHTVALFRDALPNARIVVSLPGEQIGYWEELCRRHSFVVPLSVVKGGPTRYLSVSNALEACGECDYIAIHDGVRPLASVQMIRRTLEEAAMHGNAVPAVQPNDSFRLVEEESSRTLEKEDSPSFDREDLRPIGRSTPVDRAALRAVQTPQIFAADIIRRAYTMQPEGQFTDDATVVEQLGIKIHLCAGEENNIKITRALDMTIAEAVLKNRNKSGHL